MRTVGVPSDALLRYPLEVRYATDFSLRRRWLPAPLGLAAGLLLARKAYRLRSGSARCASWPRCGACDFRVEPDITVKQFLDDHGQHGRMRPLPVGAAVRLGAEHAARPGVDQRVPRRAARYARRRRRRERLPPAARRSFAPVPGAGGRISSARAAARCAAAPPSETLETLKTQFRRIIVAVGPHQLKTLLPEAIADFTYQPIYTCYLQYPEATRLAFPMLGMADGLVQWVFDRGALLGENGRLACVISAQGDHQQMTQDELAETCHRELARAKLVAQEPLWTRVIAEKRATITCTPGLRRPEVQTPTA